MTNENPRSTKKTKVRVPNKHMQERFLRAYANCGNVTAAARQVKCDRTSHYDWLKDPEYAKAFENCHEEAIEVLENALRKRAMKADTTAAIFLLKALKPEVYRERHDYYLQGQIQHGGQVVVMLPGTEHDDDNENPPAQGTTNEVPQE